MELIKMGMSSAKRFGNGYDRIGNSRLDCFN